nr:hypothetical protein [Actinospica robiniae]
MPLAQFAHALIQQHERGAQLLLFLGSEIATVKPPDRLSFHELPQQLDDGEH